MVWADLLKSMVPWSSIGIEMLFHSSIHLFEDIRIILWGRKYINRFRKGDSLPAAQARKGASQPAFWK